MWEGQFFVEIIGRTFFVLSGQESFARHDAARRMTQTTYNTSTGNQISLPTNHLLLFGLELSNFLFLILTVTETDLRGAY
jgi:hypothetical protein